ncbi:MAG TPA: diguanylate cyclase, partial [Burkholderiaceae bacterium]|nr:diguanylate cyclase [Burkholderiaceae bacterium]
STPIASKVTGRMMVVFTMPLRGPEGDIFGVMAGTVPLESQELLPSTLTMLGQFASALVVYTRDGVILSHPEKSRMMQNAKDEPGLGPAFAEWVADGRTVFTEGVARLVPGYMVTMAGVPASQWMVARVTASEQALGPLRAVQKGSWGIVALIMGFCAASAALVIVWMTQPISRLRDRAEQTLRSDDAPDEGWPRARGEIGDLVRVFRKVTVERARAHESELVMIGQLRAILNHASIGIIITRDRRFELVGRHIMQMLGYSEEELLGQPARLIYPSDDAYAELGKRVGEQMQAHGHFDGEVLFRRKDGSEFWGHMLGRSLVPGDAAGGTLWIMHDVTAAREAQRQLSWSATHDSLTQLVNRREFEARLMQAMVQFDYRDVCVMFVDLDHFKPINDTAGHAAGDDALRQVAKLLEERVRQSDTVARLGGDEFAILLPGCSLRRAEGIAEQVRLAVEAWQLKRKGKVFRIGASIGIVELTPGLIDVATVLHAADTACYQAKHAGRNRVVVYVPSLAGISTRGADV